MNVQTGDFAAALLGAAAACGSYGILIEQFDIRVRLLELSFPNLPAAFDGFTILHLSDLHTTKFGLLERRLANLLSQRETDLCVITGDISQTLRASQAFHRLVDTVRRREPTVYAVLGNSEHKPWISTDALIRALSREDLRFLINSSAALRRGEDSLVLVGVDDPYSRLADLDSAFEGVNPEDFIIFLTHCPSTTPEAIKRGADLILAGHTHGGQIRLPFLGVLWSHMRAFRRLNDGLYTPERLSKLLKRNCRSSVLFVNRGVGTSKFHVRFLCPPEIAYITLRRATY
ncbi:MAG: metallophosphoesterase [Armatimonadota bacterium]|nr:metallophosphoesterase [Armatimonadota bacterium]